MEESEYICQINYRGISVPVYKRGEDFYALIAAKEALIGPWPYEQKLKRLIDKNIGMVRDFGDGFCLCWIDNGGHEDLALLDGFRIIRIYLAEDPSKADLKKAESAAERDLRDFVRKKEKLKTAKISSV